MVNASSGRIFVTIPSDHFGPILAENDLERNQGNGVCIGPMLLELQNKQSMVLSGGYEDDEDHGEWFLYGGKHVIRYLQLANGSTIGAAQEAMHNITDQAIP
ncbi:hypothetical protein KY285_017996 [Solanum tuberosum]|nr:hypothetical protein KY289_018155 [Solanum tuberosum]KAH0703718.1 hypothetical protein KY285_017996 [Solanum tuberosum]